MIMDTLDITGEFRKYLEDIKSIPVEYAVFEYFFLDLHDGHVVSIDDYIKYVKGEINLNNVSKWATCIQPVISYTDVLGLINKRTDEHWRVKAGMVPYNSGKIFPYLPDYMYLFDEHTTSNGVGCSFAILERYESSFYSAKRLNFIELYTYGVSDTLFILPDDSYHKSVLESVCRRGHYVTKDMVNIKDNQNNVTYQMTYFEVRGLLSNIICRWIIRMRNILVDFGVLRKTENLSIVKSDDGGYVHLIGSNVDDVLYRMLGFNKKNSKYINTISYEI